MQDPAFYSVMRIASPLLVVGGATIGYLLAPRRARAAGRTPTLGTLVIGAMVGGFVAALSQLVAAAYLAPRGTLNGGAVREALVLVASFVAFGALAGILGTAMRRIGRKQVVIVALAVVGVAAIVSTAFALVLHQALVPQDYPGIAGIVYQPSNGAPSTKPAAATPVFLDRGTGPLERFVTDSAGRFEIPLQGDDRQYAVILICVPGGTPMVDRAGLRIIGDRTYHPGVMPPGMHAPIRDAGLRGPIPHGCAADSTFFWRLQQQGPTQLTAVSPTEPDWNAKPLANGAANPAPAAGMATGIFMAPPVKQAGKP